MNILTSVLEKLLPARFWAQRPLKPDEVWSALAQTNEDNPTLRAVLHIAQDRYVTHMQSAQQMRRDNPARVEQMERAWEMAEFITQVEEDRMAAPEMVRRKSEIKN
jgi:hypothetical protein